MRDGGKPSNFFLCWENHKKMILSKLSKYDIYFHSHSVDDVKDKQLVETLNPLKYSFDKTNYISDSFIETNTQIQNLNGYDLIINLRFDLLFQVTFDKFNIDNGKFNFLWEEKKHYRKQLGYKKVTDLAFAMAPKYVEAFKTSLVATRLVGNRGTGHHIYPHLCDSIGEDNIQFMLSENYNSNTDNENNKHVVINRNP